MTEQAPDRIWSGIDISKTLAAALAAVCAAVVGSFLGVAGTLVGAAVASIVGSVGTEIYERSITRGKRKLGTLAPTFVKVPAAVGTPAVAAAADEEKPSQTEPPARRQIRWGRVALVAGALFIVVMGALTITELVTGKSVASTVGNDTKARSTITGLLDPGSGPATPAPAPTPTPSEVAPSTAAPEEPTAPATAPASEAPTSAPASDVPSPTAPASVAPTGGSQPGQGIDAGQDQNTNTP